MIYLLLGITVVFFVLNYYISDRDYLAPAPVFCLMFFLSEMVILIFKDYFLIKLHPVTVGILSLGFAVFTVVSYLEKTFTRKGFHFERRKSEYEHLENQVAYELKPIHVNSFMVVLLIIIQIAAICAFMSYLKQLMIAYNVFPGTLSERIDLYDKCTKFWPKVSSRLNVSLPMIYRICNPISEAGAYVMLFVVIHNFAADKKVNLLYAVPVVLLCVLIVLNGSRSPLFRVMTFALILYYILECRNRKLRRGSFKLLIWIGVAMIVAAILFVVMLQLMGRTTENGYDIRKYLFIYTGAPIVNLDTWLTHKIINYGHPVLGSQTFISLYNYIGKIFGISYLQYGNIDKFAYLHNMEIGNVYTIYYKMLYDFGAAGMIPVFAVFAYYYEHTYRKIVHEPDTVHVMDYRLFIYVYLFNDLVMSFFSTRFYETIFNAPFLKILLLSFIFWQVLIENRFDLSPQKITDTIFDFMKKFIKVPVSEYEQEDTVVAVKETDQEKIEQSEESEKPKDENAETDEEPDIEEGQETGANDEASESDDKKDEELSVPEENMTEESETIQNEEENNISGEKEELSQKTEVESDTEEPSEVKNDKKKKEEKKKAVNNKKEKKPAKEKKTEKKIPKKSRVKKTKNSKNKKGSHSPGKHL